MALEIIKLQNEQIKLLKEIGMVFEFNDEKWIKNV